MDKTLEGQTIAILATDGVERIELEEPRGALLGAGARTEVLSVHDGEIQARQMDIDSAGTIPVDRLVSRRARPPHDLVAEHPHGPSQRRRRGRRRGARGRRAVHDELAARPAGVLRRDRRAVLPPPCRRGVTAARSTSP